MELEILEKFCNTEELELSVLNGNKVSVLSKAECVEELQKAENRQAEIMQTGRHKRTENLCKILLVAMELKGAAVDFEVRTVDKNSNKSCRRTT